MNLRISGLAGELSPLDAWGDSWGGAWKRLADQLRSAGFTIARAGFGKEEPIDGLVALNHSAPALSEAIAMRVPTNRRMLVLWEPRVTDPTAHAEVTLREYGRILAPSPRWPNSGPADVFRWPQNLSRDWDEDLGAWIRRSPVPVLVQSNKFSAVPGERYSLRRRVIRHAHRSPSGINVYGPGWDRPVRASLREWSQSAWALAHRRSAPIASGLTAHRPPNGALRGPADQKDAAVRRHRVAVCIENSGDYVSEKAFDAIRCLTLPVYVGPRDLFPRGLSIDPLIADPDPRAVVQRVLDLMRWPEEEQFALATQLYTEALRSPDTPTIDATVDFIGRSIIAMMQTASGQR